MRRALLGRRAQGVALLCALSLVGVLVAAPAAAQPSLGKEMRGRLAAQVERELRRVHLPGAIVGVSREGREPWTIARGVANLETRRPMTVRSHVRIGSVTKAFVTTLLMELAQEGRLSLDDPISAYVAGVPSGDAITLRQLANMTSGLSDYFSNEQFSIEYLTGETFTPDHLIELGLALPPRYPPGTGWWYSNTNTALLGVTIERVTGEPLARLLRERVLRPLRLRETSLPSSPSLPRPFAHGYTRQTPNGRLGDATFATPTATWAAGGMVSTVRDLLRAAPTFATGRPLLDRSSQAERLDWVTFPPNSPIQQYGIGLLGFDGWIGHNGGIPGYTAIAWHLPQRELSLVVLVNSDIHRGATRPGYAYEPASELAHRLTEILTPNHVAPGAVKLYGSPVTDAG
jgi:D-alanyl-D-alanine carboxypeptidase